MTNNEKSRKSALLFFSVVAIASCSTNQNVTLGKLSYKPQKEAEAEFKPTTHKDLRKEYTELLSLFEEQQLKEKIERRIADVYMMEGTQLQNHVNKKKSHYVEAIKAYRNILDKYPNSPDNAEVLYQLAKAYDLEGDHVQALEMLDQLVSKHPYFPNLAEAQFRRGDILFNSGNYAKAEKAYTAVTLFTETNLLLNAYYMKGWALYKQYHFRKALDSYAYVLNEVVGESGDLSGGIETLDKSVRPLTGDTIHAMSLSLDKLEGATSIETIDRVGGKPFVWMLYENLGRYYLEKERFEDSADAFRLYIQNYPITPQAPILHAQLIDAYVKAKFPKKVLEEKSLYADLYGIDSQYFKARKPLSEETLKNLHVFIGELAEFFHEKGQASETLSQELREKLNAKNLPAKGKVDLEKDIAKQGQVQLESYGQAIKFYSQFLDTFPEDSVYDRIVFQRAEAKFSSKKFDTSIEDYEFVAYSPIGNSAAEHAADAGYAAIISYQKHIDWLEGAGKNVKDWQAAAVDSMLRFAQKFHEDKRSPSVLTNTAEYLFSLDQYERAVEVSSALIEGNTQLDNSLKKTALGIMAHSYFKLAKFDNARVSYLNQRQLVEAGSEEYETISTRLAASIIEIAKEHKKAERFKDAATQLLTIKTLAPNVALRVPAQYEAASLLMTLEAWPEAIVELEALLESYKGHPLAIEFPRNLALAYEKNQQWLRSAALYEHLSLKDPDLAVRQEAYFLSGKMYQLGEQFDKAIDQFKQYYYQYTESFDQIMEVCRHLAENYEAIADEEKRRYWLRKMIEHHSAAGNKETERSRWLASWSNSVLGDHYFSAFSAAPMYLPLSQSLAEKVRLLKRSSDYFQASASLGILDFVTQSSHRIASLYHELFDAMLSSPVPRGISGEDRKLYQQILEEKALPHLETAKKLLQANIDRAWDGEYNEWIAKSFEKMSVIDPSRFGKQETIVGYGDEIR